MSIDFATLQGVTIPEGVVTQIADASGNVLWALSNEPVAPMVLEVEKITSDTYAGETTYSGESFVLLDIYSVGGTGTVNVTYGGLTKTLEFASTANALQVFFGTFNGVSDGVETPSSGTLTIEGDVAVFCAVGTYKTYSNSKTTTKYCSCITAVTDWGEANSQNHYYSFALPAYAFYGCSSLALTSLPRGVYKIGNYAFYDCTNLALTELPSGIMSIGTYAFYKCENITLTELPSGIKSIEASVFRGCSALALTELPSGITSIGSYAFQGCKISEITIGVNVTTIGDGAFAGQYPVNRLTVTILATTPPTISTTTPHFSYKRDSDTDSRWANIIVPVGYAEIYKAAEGWSEYAYYITEAS